MEAILQGFQLFQAGGPVMYLLLACSLFVGYIAIERALFYGNMDAGKAFAEQFYTQMKLRRCDQAQQLAAGAHGGLPLILQEVFQGQSGPDVKAFVEMQSGIFIAKLRNRLYYLSVIVTMAPLLGLLGTISGMIRAFSVLNIQSGQAIAITGGSSPRLSASAWPSWPWPSTPISRSAWTASLPTWNCAFRRWKRWLRKWGSDHAITQSPPVRAAFDYDYPHDRHHVLPAGLLHDDVPVHG